ncbi:MAG: hypothetical protein M1816_005304 [Peltula sp. TS41687]|nr:MAG: hypothetical protein M1816_005304 [Peltula sp. TS41687]
MAIPNEALQKASLPEISPNHEGKDLIREIETQAVVAQQQINIVKAQIAAKQRDLRLLQLTSNEVTDLPKDTKAYEGVGKMFVSSPVSDIKKRLGGEMNELRSDLSNLEKKLHYLETTHKNSRSHIDQIMRSGGGGSRS